MGRRAVELDEADPKNLVRESYQIEGITLDQCRSILVDWALSVRHGLSMHDALRAVIAVYATGAPDHPMTAVLHEGLSAPEEPRRRGGRAGRAHGTEEPGGRA